MKLNRKLRISDLVYSQKLGCYVYRVLLPGSFDNRITCKINGDQLSAYKEYTRQKSLLTKRHGTVC